MFFGVEISDDRKYVCVRRLMAGLKQQKKKQKTLRRVLRAGRLLAVREGGILLGVIFKLLIGLGGSFSDKWALRAVHFNKFHENSTEQ